ncbi:hypothetical protein KRR40_02460 [Niabella defluvii]|nr:hypothetical protein KRR40_02460 [Niabella sp. I65]
MIFDSTTQKLYVNVGAKFDEENPAAIFPEMVVEDSTVVADADATAATEGTAKKTEKKDKKKARLQKALTIY